MFDTEDQEQIERELSELRTISSTFENYMTNQLYVSKYGPEEYSDADLLQDGYVTIEAELRALGIYIDGDLYDDGYQRRVLYHFRTFFDGDHLKELFIQHPEWKDTVRAILDSDENMDDTINELIDYFYGVYETNYTVRQLYTKWLECTSNESFDAHLRAVLAEADMPVAAISDPATAAAYISFIEKGRKDAYLAARMIFDSLVTHEYNPATSTALQGLEWDDIVPYLNKYDLDKVSSDEVSYYSMFDDDFNTNKLPECVQAKAKEYMDRHHQRSHHHIEYWIYRCQQGILHADANNTIMLAPAILVMLVSHHFKPGMSDVDMKQAVKNMFLRDNMPEALVPNRNVMIELCNAFRE